MTWWRRFWDGAGWGALIGFAVVLVLGVVLVFVFNAGLVEGRRAERTELERTGGGRYVELVLDGRTYRGWVR